MNRLVMLLILLTVLTPSLAHAASPITTCVQLLTEFEDAIKYSAQTADWQARRAAWQTALRAATTPAQLGTQLVVLEQSLRAPALTNTWPGGRRAAWEQEAAAATTLAAIARLTGELETAMFRTSFDAPWATRRAAWRQALDGLVSADAGRLATLLTTFEEAVKFEVQDKAWREERTGWTQTLATGFTMASLRGSLLQFEKALAWSATRPEWPDARDRWLGQVAAAPDAAALASLLLELADYLTVDAMNKNWDVRRALWRQEIAALAGVTLPAATASTATSAPTATTATTGSTSDDWGDDWGTDTSVTSTTATTTAAAPALPVEDAVKKLGVLLREFDGELLLTKRDFQWLIIGADWENAVNRATTISTIRESIVRLEGSVKNSGFLGTWPARRDAWKAACRAAETMAALAPLVVELDTQLQDNASSNRWKSRREAWRGEVAALGN